MDLATLIVDSATETFKQECISNISNVTITVHNRYKYVISIIPMSKHVIIKYKTLEYKVSKDDKSSYNEIIDYLLNAIDDDVYTSLNWEIEWADYWPDHDEDYCKNSLKIERKEEMVFGVEFKRDKLKSVSKMHLKCMRLLA